MLSRHLSGRAGGNAKALRHHPANPSAPLVKVFRLQVSADGSTLTRRPRLQSIQPLQKDRHPTWQLTFQVEGVAKPACVAEILMRYYS